jgi:hypothetical protein
MFMRCKLRKKGNPNWGKTCGDIPNMPTSFEEMARRLKLSKDGISEFYSVEKMGEKA